jgi:hypothetical protein
MMSTAMAAIGRKRIWRAVILAVSIYMEILEVR